jgi:glutathione S-transferase
MSKAGKTYDLKFEQTLDAPVERVWKAITDGKEVGKWYGPADEFRIEVLAWDCRVGGAYKVAMFSPQGGPHVVVGVFKEITPGRKLAYSWAWEGGLPMETLVTFTLKANGRKTDLPLTHEGFPNEGIRDNHNGGWTGSLERLARAVA